MSHELKIALFALIALAFGVGVLVFGLVFVIPRVTKGFGVGAYLTQRASLLARVEAGQVSVDVVMQIEELTRRMLSEVTTDHMKAAIQRELENVHMARMAIERGDERRASDFLTRVGRRMVRLIEP